MRKTLSMIEEWKSRVWVHRILSYAIDIVSSLYDKAKPPVVLESDGKRVSWSRRRSA